MGINDCDACTRCTDCNERLCLDVDPGMCHHGEAICDHCWPGDCKPCREIAAQENAADTRTEADLLAAHDSLGFVSVEWAQIAENDAEMGAWWAPALGSQA